MNNNALSFDTLKQKKGCKPRTPSRGQQEGSYEASRNGQACNCAKQSTEITTYASFDALKQIKWFEPRTTERCPEQEQSASSSWNGRTIERGHVSSLNGTSSSGEHDAGNKYYPVSATPCESLQSTSHAVATSQSTARPHVLSSSLGQLQIRTNPAAATVQ